MPASSTPHQTWDLLTTWLFSNCTGKGMPTSSAVHCKGDKVALVKMIDRGPSLANLCMLNPGLKHQRLKTTFSLLFFRKAFPLGLLASPLPLSSMT